MRPTAPRALSAFGSNLLSRFMMPKSTFSRTPVRADAAAASASQRRAGSARDFAAFTARVSFGYFPS